MGVFANALDKGIRQGCIVLQGRHNFPLRKEDSYSVEKVGKSLGEVGCPQGEDSSPREVGCFGVRQVALSKYSCLRERICWWIVF
jgi:hypothetical protein